MRMTQEDENYEYSIDVLVADIEALADLDLEGNAKWEFIAWNARNRGVVLDEGVTERCEAAWAAGLAAIR